MNNKKRNTKIDNYTHFNVRDKNLPSLTIIIITLNSIRTIKKALSSIEMQDYPRKRLEVVIVDGNSTDGTISEIKKSNLNIRIIQSKYPNDPEACRAVGITNSSNEILGFIDSDNYLPHKYWIKKMLIPFINHTDIYGVQTLRYAYRKLDSPLNRYFALFGASDPIAFYLNKADRLSYLYEKWNLSGEIISNFKYYFIIEFSKKSFPTLGCNGFFFRKKIVYKINISPENFFHIDTPFDLASKGYNRYGIINDVIIHDTAASLLSFLEKRGRYMRLHYQSRSENRRYKIFDLSDNSDRLNLLKFIIYTITFIQPIYLSTRGYFRVKDRVWFIHPLFCFSILVTYTISTIFGLIQIKFKNRRI